MKEKKCLKEREKWLRPNNTIHEGGSKRMLKPMTTARRPPSRDMTSPPKHLTFISSLARRWGEVNEGGVQSSYCSCSYICYTCNTSLGCDGEYLGSNPFLNDHQRKSSANLFCWSAACRRNSPAWQPERRETVL